MATTMLNPRHIPFRIEQFRAEPVGETSRNVSTRVAVWFGALFVMLVVLPFPFTLLPETRAVAQPYLTAWSSATGWLGGLVGMTGTAAQLLAYGVIAFLVTVVSVLVDPRDVCGPLLLRIANATLRFWLGAAMLEYGVSRCLAADASTIAAGVMACTAAVALFWHRTATIGALIACVGSLSIVVPSYQSGADIDLQTWEIVAGAILLVLADAPRLTAALLGFATRARETGSALESGWLSWSTLVKIAVVGMIVFAKVDPYVAWPT